MRNLLLCAFCLLAGACASAPTPPRFETIFPQGSARSDDAEIALTLGTLGASLTPRVCEMLQVEPDPPFVLWHDPQTPTGGLLVGRNFTGETVQRWILLGDAAIRDRPRFAVAHELVHWYAGGAWDKLPSAVEEGLADRIAMQLAPESRMQRESELQMQLLQITEQRRDRALSVTDRGWSSADARARDDAYAVGYEIVSRIGIDGLLALCDRAEAESLEHVPAAWLTPAQAASPAPHSTTWTIRLPLIPSSP